MTREQRRADVAERADRDRHAAARRGRRVVVDARHRLDDRRVRGPVAVRRLDRVAEAGDRHVDRAAGATAAIVVVAEAHAVHRAGLEVLGDHVEVRRQREERARGPRASSGRCRRCACRGCCAGRWRRPCGPRDRPSPGCDAAARLAVLGCSTFTTSAPSRASSCVAYGSACICSSGEHAHAVERLAVLRRVLVRHVAEPHVRATRRGPEPGTDSSDGPSGRRPPRRPCSHARNHQSLAATCRTAASTAREIASPSSAGGGKGTRTVASYDEDTTTMGVEAARLALRGAATLVPGAAVVRHRRPRVPRQDNATAIHAALRLDTDVPAFDFGGVAALRRRRAPCSRSTGNGRVARGRRRRAHGLAGQRRRSRRAATAPPRSSSATDADGPVIAEYLGAASATDEFIDRWRTPGEQRTQGLGGAVRRDAVRAARRAGVERRARRRPGSPPSDVDRADRHRHARRAVARAIGGKLDGVAGVDRRPGGDRRQHRRRAARRCCSPTRSSRPSPARSIALVVLADGADVLLFRTTDAIGVVPAGAPGRDAGRERRRRCPTASSSRGAACSPVEPPRRPEPRRISATAAARSEDWKFGFVGSQDRDTGVRAPAARARLARRRRASTRWSRRRWPTSQGTIVTFTVDRIAYSPSPPIVFAVVDFDGGGRLPVELTDVDADELADRRPGRDDVPPAVHRRRHPQLLLEGHGWCEERTWVRTASRTGSRSSAWGARRSASTGTRASTTC